MNCRGSGTSAASGNTPWLPRALERHAVPERLMMVDAALAEEARNGNAAAFVKLAKRWWTPLYRVSWNISGSASRAAQITERTLLAAIHSVEPPPFTRVPFKVFLYRVAVRLTLTREPPASTGRNLSTRMRHRFIGFTERLGRSGRLQSRAHLQERRERRRLRAAGAR